MSGLDQTRPDRTGPDQTRPDQTTPDHSVMSELFLMTGEEFKTSPHNGLIQYSLIVDWLKTSHLTVSCTCQRGFDK